MSPTAVWKDDAAWIEDEAQASRIIDKTGAGRRQGTHLALDAIEAAWLATEGRITLDGITLAGLLREHTAEHAYLLYCDLRARGLMVRLEGDVLAVWARGQGPPAPAEWRVVPCGERDGIEADTIARWAREGMCAGVVDEDAAVTYYRVAQEGPDGELAPAALERVPATALAAHVVLEDDAPYRIEAIGTPHPAGLLLSPVEAAHLRRRGVIDVDPPTTPRLAVQSAVYDDLRRRAVVPRSGLRYGADLRAYRGRPDAGHADWLVQCAEPEEILSWSSLSRGVRLAHSVRKRFLVATAHDPVAYAWVSWHRP